MHCYKISEYHHHIQDEFIHAVPKMSHVTYGKHEDVLLSYHQQKGVVVLSHCYLIFK